MNSKDFAIGILSTTAVILLVGLLVVHSRPAHAAGVTTTSGRYILTVGNVQIGNEELLYVVDTADKKMIAYRFNGASKKIEPAFGQDLSKLEQGAATSKQAPNRRRRP